MKVLTQKKTWQMSHGVKAMSKFILFNKYFSFTTKLPGSSNLKIEVWDYDPLFSDELIGYTRIDVEDRFFDNNWVDMVDKPIEKRMLKHPDIEGVQGWVSLWIECFEKKDRSLAINKKKDISPPPTQELEMRLIVWETEGIPNADVEGTTDMYIVAFIDAAKKQSTDMHFRCQTGRGSFNWRVVLPVSYPTKNSKLQVQVFDNDFFSYDDFISDNTLDIDRLLREVYSLDVPIKFDKAYWEGLPADKKRGVEIEFNSEDKTKFWLTLHKQGKNGVEAGGKVLLSLEILPHWKAQICKVGKGRDQPNINPFLPPPIGRFEWSLNPFKMLVNYICLLKILESMRRA